MNRDYKAAFFGALKALINRDGNEKLVSIMPDREYRDLCFLLGKLNDLLQSVDNPESQNAIKQSF